jgi:signal transduction histidine kinase
MRNSLLFKLMGTFLLVIAIGALVISVLVSQATRSAFNLYTTRSGQVWAQRLAIDLADYYAQAHSWQGVEAVLQADIGTQGSPGMMGNGPGSEQRSGSGSGWQNSNSGMMAGMGQRLILVDEKGVVISDTQNTIIGQQISSTELMNGAGITVNDQLVGTIIVTLSGLPSSGTPAGEFLDSVNQAIISSVIIAGVIAMILGGILFIQIISPLRQLKKATSAIAAGNLDERVNIRSQDEFGELGTTFNRMAESLATAETQRQHMVADVAHELRTPLAAVQATLEGIQDKVLPLDEEQINALYSETMLLNRLVGDLKLISLVEAGQLHLEKREIKPGIFIGQIVERLKPQADQKNIHLEIKLPPDIPDLFVDSDRITQVLTNLIINALRYTPEGGTITIQAIFPAPGGFIQISITDTGLGIDPESLPFIFDRFYRADKSRTRASGGSGLGLAIVKQLVEAHGGKVFAESPVFKDENQRGYGTSISFTLPGLNR